MKYPEERIGKVAEILLVQVMSMLAHGMSYAEGQATFKAGVFLMEEIDKNPNINADQLAAKVHELVTKELEK